MRVEAGLVLLALASVARAQDVPRPDWVRSGEVNDDGAVVYSAADEHSPRRGTVAAGTRLPLGAGVKGPGCGDFRFVQVGDEAFMCERSLTWSRHEPGGDTQPPVAAGALLPHEYLFVGSHGIGAFARPADLEADDFALVFEKDFGLMVRERVRHEGTALVRSAHGYYVRERDLRARPVSTFSGVVITDGKLDGVSWVVRKRVVRPRPLDVLPQGLAPGERFVDVDTERQVLVVYEGAKPIFATLVSTGVAGADTPRGEFRIWAKLTTSDMNDTERVDVERNYSIESVPWVQFFHESIALHAAFWHERFGERQSHGCVNLSPRDARTVFELTQPALPPGFYAILPTAAAPGGRVLVR